MRFMLLFDAHCAGAGMRARGLTNGSCNRCGLVRWVFQVPRWLPCRASLWAHQPLLPRAIAAQLSEVPQKTLATHPPALTVASMGIGFVLSIVCVLLALQGPSWRSILMSWLAARRW